jgi:predicted dehydrogenase
VLAVGMTRRLYPAVAAARALIAGGLIGGDVRFVFREGSVYGWPIRTDAAFRRASAGGGVLMDFGSHAIDLLLRLFGTPTVRSYADDALRDGVETNCRAGLDFPSAQGVLQLSWNQPLVTELRVSGSAGELALHPADIAPLRFRAHGAPWRTEAAAGDAPADLAEDGERMTPRTYHDCIYLQLVQTLRAIARGEPAVASGEDARTVVRAIEACYEKARPLAAPWLDAAEQAAIEQHHWRRELWAT